MLPSTYTDTKTEGYYGHDISIYTSHRHLLTASVGFASLLPKFTVTRLCSATVEISNGSAWFCCKLAVLSGSTAADVALVPATWLCAGTLVGSLAALDSTGGAGAAAALPAVEEDDDAAVVADDVAADADAEIAASPEAIIVTPGPAGACAVPTRRPAVVSVAELTLTVDEVVEAMACCAPGGAGPATTVMADAIVCIVLAELELMDPSWNG
jgi:hypothetical protein